MSQAQQRSAFARRFHRQPELLVRAPGRVNLIGEHTDYNNGFVLPAAIDYYTYVAASRREDRRLRVWAENFSEALLSVDLDAPMQPDPAMPWSNYLRGVVQALQGRGFALAGADLWLAGEVPVGAGLSSSASLEVALARALVTIAGGEIDPRVAARVGQAAENDFVGCACGIMDQLASACGRENSALLIDCENLEITPVPIPAHWRLLIVHSGVQRGLVDSLYNERRAQCEQVAAHFGAPSLRQVTPADLQAAGDQLDAVARRRAHHVLTENQRTLDACEALRKADMAALGGLMAASHASMRDDFAITTPAIDTLVDILVAAGGGEVGARMTGGGFGGCVVAVAPAERVPALSRAVREHYFAATGCTPTLIPARAAAGAFAGEFGDQ